MHWIYISPHLDDIALSCGGMVWEQSQAGESIQIWTICAGDPPAEGFSPFAESLHDRWETPALAWQHRRDEDLRSCQILGAGALHFPIPDCIYRRSEADGMFLYDSEESLWGEIHPAEGGLVERLAEELARALPQGTPAVQLVCPWTFGGHVDHRLTRAAAERLVRREGIPALWFYADYPYILKEPLAAEKLRQAGLADSVCPVSTAGLGAWQEAVGAHSSQISTFWPDLDAMRDAIRFFCEWMGGVRLWKPVMERFGNE